MFKSKAQKKKLWELVEAGKFPKEKYEEYEKASVGKRLPDKIEAKPGGLLRRPRRDRK